MQRMLQGMLRRAASATAFLVRRPGYSLTVIATLALGMGAVTATYALVRGVLLDPLPFPDADRLVLVRQQNAGGQWNTSVVDQQAVAESPRSFEGVAAMRSADALVGAGERAEWASARWVTADYFRVLGLAPARGRSFAPQHDREGAPRTVVLGHAFAQRRFAGADPLGQSLLVDGTAHTVVGVMPPGLESLPATRADFWPLLQLATPERRGPFQLATLARLRPGITLAAANQELDEISRRIFPLWQAGFQDETARLVALPLQQVVIGNAGDFLWVAFGAVLVVLLIALVNNTNLMLMRISERNRDLGVRAALGATRWRLARLLMGENLVLTLLGGVLGLALAAALLAGYQALGPALPRLADVVLDLRVAVFAAGLSVACGLVFALLPLAAGAVGGAAALLGEARGASTGRQRAGLRNALVVLEFALALPLLLATSLLLDSLQRLQRVDAGIAADNLLLAEVRLPANRYPDAAARLAFWERALPELRALPGVEAAALAGQLPPSCGCYNNFDLVGRPAPQGNQPQSPWVPATPALFGVLGVPLLEGRVFDSRDTAESSPVLLVSATWAERYFPGESAIGKQLYEGGGDTPVTIVGVVGDVKFDGLAAPGDVVFASIGQGAGGDQVHLLLRTAGEPLAQANAMRATLQRLDPAVVPANVGSMAERLGNALGNHRHWATVIAAFALSGLLLAGVGVFGVVAFHVAQRQREFGICRALGADGRRIARMVLQRGLAHAAAGIALGALLALALNRSLETLLFEVRGNDPASWLAASAVLLLAGVAACLVPARRATRVDPAIVLRQE